MPLNRPSLAVLVLFLLACQALAKAPAKARDPFRGYGVTLGDPWFGIKYNFEAPLGVELRVTVDPEVKVTYLRGNYYFVRRNPFQLFAGLEYGIIRFDMPDIAGRGTVITPSFGAEYSFHEKFSVSADVGYSLISLKSGNTSLSGPEYTFNIWLSLYPFH